MDEKSLMQGRLINLETELGIKFGLENKSARLKDIESSQEDLKNYVNSKLMNQWGEFRRLVSDLRIELEKEIVEKKPKEEVKSFWDFWK